MAYLVLVGDTNPFESQPQPSVGFGRVEVLLPIVVGGDFLGESKMEQREEVHQLVIGIFHFGLAIHFRDVTPDKVAMDEVVELFCK